MVTVPGLVAAVSAPLITVATGRVDRRIVLAALIGMMGAANLASAFATSFTVVLIARFLIGLSVGGFWSLAGGIALRLVPPHQVPRATAVIFGGVETASVLGVPAGTIIGDLSGWRTAFAAVGLLGLAALTCMLVLLPAMPPQRTITLADLPRTFRDSSAVRVGVAMTFLLITGHFTAYTFVRPVLLADGVPADLIGVLLLVFGVAGICGNFIAGALVGTRLRQTALGIAVLLTAAMAALAAAEITVAAAAALLILWGLGYGAVPVALQTWMLTAAPERTEAASSLLVCAFNLSIAIGALLGGLAVGALPTSGVLWIGAGLAALTVITLKPEKARMRRVDSAR
ncbi:MFS transporter [Actinoplanes aureus]|uniref:MFS transporter n=1 Tax=Actinoplanes aureus TaxID=2792083 RepID=A0A931FZM6_9ACTN|nr:MFS transporter [Actinoplanes aureus]MBG0565828.1 MFS transporter [Actinoplanes aureus]